MNEESKNTVEELTDEAVEKITGGYERIHMYTKNVTCPSCKHAYSYGSTQAVDVPPNCPNCGHQWTHPVGPTGS